MLLSGHASQGLQFEVVVVLPQSLQLGETLKVLTPLRYFSPQVLQKWDKLIPVNGMCPLIVNMVHSRTLLSSGAAEIGHVDSSH